MVIAKAPLYHKNDERKVGLSNSVRFYFFRESTRPMTVTAAIEFFFIKCCLRSQEVIGRKKV